MSDSSSGRDSSGAEEIVIETGITAVPVIGITAVTTCSSSSKVIGTA